MTVLLGWLTAFVSGSTCLLLFHNRIHKAYTNVENVWSNAFGSSYEALHRTVWGCVIGWIVLACHTGNGSK